VLCDTRSEADTDEAKLKRAAGMLSVKKTGSAPFADGWLKVVFAPETLTKKSAAVEMIRGIIAHTPPLSIAGTLLALASRTDTSRSLASITVPTLILVGEHDAATPPSASLSMHEKIRTSSMHIVPGAGHMSNLENVEFFNAKLLAFLHDLPPLAR
jgi:pimeloyl-ACP methyl ester carboxylesterase